jgi:metallo-beta-lactamase family protein
VPVKAEIMEMGQFSAHAGKSELLRWLTGLQATPRQVYLTHGEPTPAQMLQQAIMEKFKWNCTPAKYLDTVSLDGSS